MKYEHKIVSVEAGSIADEMEITSGDTLLTINGEELTDIFDYQFQIEDESIVVVIRKPDGEEWELEIEKDADEDLGIRFENGLMDEYRSCRNKCIFCFIDQMPPGMRETLYFKDDDSRLSFLQGNYITLTNMSDKDIDRIIRYHLDPINISFHTMNPALRCKMLHNRFAGDALKKVDRLHEAGIRMNGQIVLCKGVNDGDELEYSIRELTRYIPHLESVSVVPVGLSKYRENLYPLEPFTKEDALAVISTITRWQEQIYREHGTHFIHCGDEWYILAGVEVPEADNYDGYVQLENGVGMVRLFLEEFEEVKRHLKRDETIKREISFATGKLIFPYIKRMLSELCDYFPNVTAHVYEIRNDFFGEQITVSGLLTGQDIVAQLKDRELGEKLYLPQNILRSGEEVLLDDMTLEDLRGTLQVPIDIVKSSGNDFIDAVTERGKNFE